jgi:K+-transporting ATPase KdpF subunit
MCMPARSYIEVLMNIESLIMLVICVFVMVYLMYALLKPENF